MDTIPKKLFLFQGKPFGLTTGLSSRGFLKSAPVCGLNLVNQDHAFSNILAAFPELLSTIQRVGSSVGDVQHHILTNGPPVSEQARRLSPEKLAAAKAIFRQMVEGGICRPSSSPWATPIPYDQEKKRRIARVWRFQTAKRDCDF